MSICAGSFLFRLAFSANVTVGQHIDASQHLPLEWEPGGLAERGGLMTLPIGTNLAGTPRGSFERPVV
jgi:hypothetical protein